MKATLLVVFALASGCRLLGIVPLTCVDNDDCRLGETCVLELCTDDPPPAEGEGEGEGEGEIPTDCGVNVSAIVSGAPWLSVGAAPVLGFGASGQNTDLFAVAALGDDAIVGGQFSGGFILPGTAGNITVDGGKDAFIARISANGFVRWAVTAGQANSFGERVDAIAVDETGCIYVAGRGDGEMDFGTGCVVGEGFGSDEDGFLLSLHPETGECRFLTTFPGVDNGLVDNVRPVALAARPGGGVFTLIDVNEDVIVGGEVLSGDNDLVIVGTDAAGRELFHRRYGGLGPENPLRAIVDSGTLTICGSIGPSTTNDLGGGLQPTLLKQAFVAKYDLANGDYLNSFVFSNAGEHECRGVARAESGLAAVLFIDDETTMGFRINDAFNAADQVFIVDGTGTEVPHALLAHPGRDNLAVVGSTSSNTLSIGGVSFPGSGLRDALIVEVDLGTSALTARRFLGDETDQLFGGAVGPAGQLWAVGSVMTGDVDFDGTLVGIDDNIETTGVMLRLAPAN